MSSDVSDPRPMTPEAIRDLVKRVRRKQYTSSAQSAAKFFKAAKIVAKRAKVVAAKEKPVRRLRKQLSTRLVDEHY